MALELFKLALVHLRIAPSSPRWIWLIDFHFIEIMLLFIVLAKVIIIILITIALMLYQC